MNVHPAVYKVAAEWMPNVPGYTATDLACRAIDAAAPVLWAAWDVDALRAEVELLRRQVNEFMGGGW